MINVSRAQKLDYLRKFKNINSCYTSTGFEANSGEILKAIYNNREQLLALGYTHSDIATIFSAGANEEAVGEILLYTKAILDASDLTPTTLATELKLNHVEYFIKKYNLEQPIPDSITVTPVSSATVAHSVFALDLENSHSGNTNQDDMDLDSNDIDDSDSDDMDLSEDEGNAYTQLTHFSNVESELISNSGLLAEDAQAQFIIVSSTPTGTTNRPFLTNYSYPGLSAIFPPTDNATPEELPPLFDINGPF